MIEYRIERLSLENFEVLIPLMKDCFGLEVNLNYFKWKFLDNPSGNFIGFIAIHNITNEVAAYYGVIPELYSINNKRQLIFQSCDTMTHSNHRRRGLFQYLATHCFDFIQNNYEFLIIGFGGEQSLPGFVKLGWEKIFDMRYLFIPKIRCTSFSNLLIDTNFKEVNAAQVFHLAQKKPQYAVNSVRTIEHFQWRLSNPLNPCKIIDYKGEGYVAFYTLGDKLFLFDYFFSSQTVSKKLINYLKSVVKKNSLRGIITIAKDRSEAMKELNKLGFWMNPFSFGPLNVRIPFIYFTDKQTMESLSDELIWNISPYEHDAL